MGSRKADLPLDLEHDPEKWEPVFPRDKRESVCAEIMLNRSSDQAVTPTPIGQDTPVPPSPQ